MNLAMKIILTLLVITALFLGYKIYEKKSSASAPVAAENRQEEQAQGGASSVVKEKANEEELAVLRDYLQADASNEAKQRYSTLVNKYAVATSTLDISKCVASPFVTAIAQGEKLTIQNKHTEAVTMRFDSNHTYTIEANSTKILTADFGRGPGSYGFSCPNKAGISGIISIR